MGRYELVRRIATGGMAEIYLARPAGARSDGPELVVKRMLPALVNEPMFVEMFLSEARITAQLVHPNIVSVVEIGEDRGSHFYAMEYVRGSDLLELVRALSRQHRTVPLECAVAIAIAVCSALEHAHTLTDQNRRPLGVIHRDVSLANILLGYDGSVKLADFGVMRHAGRAPTEPGILKGKLGYMSPEQAMGGEIDRRTDLFALGIVLYEITTGERLFPPSERDEIVLARIRRCAITPPTELAFDYPADLAAIVMTALARNPDHRYASARDMKSDLQAWLRVHRMTGAPRTIGALVKKAFPIASPRPRPDDTADLDALVGSLPPLPARTISTEIAPVAPLVSAPSQPRPRQRSRIPIYVATACLVAGIGISVWAAWTQTQSRPPIQTALQVAPVPPPVASLDPTPLHGAATAALAKLAIRGALPSFAASSDTERVLELLRECYQSPPRDLGTDVEVAFDLVDTRIAARVGGDGIERLASCAQRAAGLLENRAVVVTITFRPS